MSRHSPIPTADGSVCGEDNEEWPCRVHLSERGDRDKIEAAIQVGFSYAQTDGDHHLRHAIVTMLKELCGDQYDEAVRRYQAGEDGPETYSWDEGIP